MRYVPHVNPFTEVRTSFILMHSESMGKSGKVKPTTKDLARAAGVSLATVDRVLNDRPGVTYKTKTAVEEAIRQLRYERNHAAAALSRNRYLKFIFALPSAQGDFVMQLRKSVYEIDSNGFGSMMKYEILNIDETKPHEVATALSQLSKNDCDGLAIMAIEHPEIRDAITRLTERGVPVISLVSFQSAATVSAFVGIPNLKAGQTAGQLMLRFQNNTSGSIAAITTTISSNDSVERRRGADLVFSTQSNFQLLPTTEHFNNPHRADDIIRRLLKTKPDLCGIYILGSEARLPLEAINRYAADRKLVVIAHELTAFTKNQLAEGCVDAVISQDTGHLVRSCVRRLKAMNEGTTPLSSQEQVRIEILIKENTYF